MKITYRKASRILLILMILGLAAMLLAGYVAVRGTVLYYGLIIFGVAAYLVVLVTMFIGFRCPACGAHFYRNALFIRICPVCGHEITDFTLGKTGRISSDVWGGGSSIPSDRLPDPREAGAWKNDPPQN